MTLPALACSALLLLAPPLRAQTMGDRGLAFGTITSGTATSVSRESASAARWSSLQIVGAGLSFQLTLPSALTGPGASIPLTFAASDGVYRFDNTNPVGGTVFNPLNPVVLPTVVVLSTLYVWLGASVSPPLNQKPGSYSGTVVLTISGLM